MAVSGRQGVVYMYVAALTILVTILLLHIDFPWQSLTARTDRDGREVIVSKGPDSDLQQKTLKDQERAEKLRRLPQAVIIGVAKTGTRALLEFLNMHPDIVVCHKEVHFYNKPENYKKGEEWYRAQMPLISRKQITIEKSPGYFTTAGVESSVFDLYRRNNITAKLIVIFRDPVERCVSQYLQTNQNHNFSLLPFEQEYFHLGTKEVKAEHWDVHSSCYSEHLEHWLKYFSKDQFLFVEAKQLLSNPLSILNKAEKFLGLEHQITERNFVFNSTMGAYCRANVKNGRTERCLTGKKHDHPSIKPWTEQALREYFHKYNLRLYKMIGNDFGWPTPDDNSK